MRNADQQQSRSIVPQTTPAPDPEYAPFEVVPQLFSEHECRQIVSRSKTRRPEAAKVIGVDGRARLSAVRRTSVWRLPLQGQDEWIHERLWSAIYDSNNRLMHFSIDGFAHDAKLLAYNESDTFTWHIDHGTGPVSCRKLTIAVLLVPANTFNGGTFEIFRYNSPEEIALGIGDAIIFSSVLLHQVKPLVKGTRYSLVNWAYGPPFR
jgi:PKHD-type hydroxylase